MAAERAFEIIKTALKIVINADNKNEGMRDE